MKTVLFILLPIPSHYYPTFGLARLLKERGYRVVYTGKLEMCYIIEREGFNFVNLLYIEQFIIRRVNVAVGLSFKSYFDSAYTKSRYREFMTRSRMFEQLISTYEPDITFLDDTLGHYFSILAGRTKVVQLSTKLSPRRRVGVPPLNYFWQPRNKFIHKVLANWFWLCHIQKRRLKQGIERFVFNGKDDFYFQRRYDKMKGIDWGSIRDENMSFYDGLKNVLSIVLATSEMEFSWSERYCNEAYIHIPTTRNESDLFSVAYHQLLEKILTFKRQDKTRFVYVSLGTLARNKYQIAKRFLLNVVNALANLKNVQVLVSTGGINLELAYVPSNVSLLPTVPQLHVLPFCDLMITHGGLGAVKECLENGVPMLVYPLNAKVDQPGNSARIVAHQFGLRGRISDSAKSIQQKVNILLNNSFYQSNCHEVQQRLKQINGYELVDDLLKRLELLEKDSVESHKLMFHR